MNWSNVLVFFEFQMIHRGCLRWCMFKLPSTLVKLWSICNFELVWCFNTCNFELVWCFDTCNFEVVCCFDTSMVDLVSMLSIYILVTSCFDGWCSRKIAVCVLLNLCVLFELQEWRKIKIKIHNHFAVSESQNSRQITDDVVMLSSMPTALPSA
jgi:uncharacterized membrane protein YjdF